MVHLNRTVNFTCTAVTQEIEWKVNGQPVEMVLNSRGFDDSSSLITLNATQNLRTRKLPVLASASNNNTDISCVVYFVNPVISVATSEPAVLLVFEPGLILASSPGPKNKSSRSNFNGRNEGWSEKYNREVGPGDWALTHSEQYASIPAYWNVQL